jgi:membrane protein implicated in regulation of membrane protease activity
MNGEVLGFTDLWLWLIFVGAGLALVMMELIVGIETGLDLVFIGTAFIIGGLVSWPFDSWITTLIVTAVICVAYVFLGRRYIHKRIAVGKAMTNIDAVIGSTGIVIKGISGKSDGRVKIRNERWRARAEEDIQEGAEVVVKSVSGTTLTVEKTEGGNQ